MRVVVQSKCKMLQGVDWQSTVFIYWVFILLQKLRILATLPVIVRSKIMIVMMGENQASNKVSLQKKIRDYLGIFPNMGGGVFPIPKTLTKKGPLNHPKISHKLY